MSGEDFEPPVIEGKPREEPITEIRDIPFALDDFLVEVDDELRLEVDIDGKRHTVELRDVKEFERDLIDMLIEKPTDKSRRGANIPIKGPWISGWLQEKGEDYINNIWHNYQFFLKFLQGFTSNIGGVSTFNRSPGTYNSLYRYIIFLEQADLLERHKRVSVPLSEYDMFVPEEMRTRTFVRVKEPYDLDESPDEVNEAWENPIKEVYGDDRERVVKIPEEEREIEEVEPEEVEPEEEEMPSIDEILGEEIEEEEAEEEIEPEPEPEPEPEETVEERSLEELGFETDQEDISEFTQQQALVNFIDAMFSRALEQTFEDPTAPSILEEIDVDISDFSPGDIGVYGPWEEGSARPGQTTLDFVMEIDSELDTNFPFIGSDVTSNMRGLLNENNPADIAFPEYNPIVSFDFIETLNQLAEGDTYYDLREQEFKEI